MKKALRTALIMLAVLLLALFLAVFAVKKLRPGLLLTVKTELSRLTAQNPLQILSQEEVTALGLRAVPADELAAWPGVRASQCMMLINTEHPLPEDFVPEISEYQNSGVLMNVCMQDAYRELAAKVYARYDEKLYVRSAYRSREEQLTQLEENPAVAAAVDASEHQAGLALDVYVPYYAGAGFIASEAGRFVNENCQDEGFIIRYPAFGERITGIPYEPWHLRYVGLPHAQAIAQGMMTLEEYVSALTPGSFYRFGEWLISRQSGDSLLVPAEFTELTLSPDNLGGFVLAMR